jgi:hypothetical protein
VIEHDPPILTSWQIPVYEHNGTIPFSKLIGRDNGLLGDTLTAAMSKAGPGHPNCPECRTPTRVEGGRFIAHSGGDG